MSERIHIAVGVDEGGQIWRGHFGIAPAYQIYDRAGNLLITRPNSQVVGQDKPPHHNTPHLITELLPECAVFIGRAMGHPNVMVSFGVTAVMTDESQPEQAIRAYLAAGQE